MLSDANLPGIKPAWLGPINLVIKGCSLFAKTLETTFIITLQRKIGWNCARDSECLTFEIKQMRVSSASSLRTQPIRNTAYTNDTTTYRQCVRTFGRSSEESHLQDQSTRIHLEEFD